MSREVIEASYVPTPDDLVAQQAYMISNSSSLRTTAMLRRRLLLSALFMPPLGALAFLGAAAVVVAVKRGYTPSQSVVTGLAVFVVVWIVQIIRAVTARPDRGKPRKHLERVIRRAMAPSEGKRCTYRFDEEGITNELDGVVMFFPWTSVVSADRQGGYWHIATKSGVQLCVAEREVEDAQALHDLIAVSVPEAAWPR